MPHVTFIHGLANKPPHDRVIGDDTRVKAPLAPDDAVIGVHHAGGFKMRRLNAKPGAYAANEGIHRRRIEERLQADGVKA